MIEEIKEDLYLCLKVKKETSIQDFCSKNNIYYGNVVFNSEELKEGDRILFCVKTGIIHVVKPAETIKSIARRYGVDESEILLKNKVKTIFIGQQLYI